MDTITRRELLRRMFRVAAVGPIVLGTRAAQEDLLLRLWLLFGNSAVGRLLRDLYRWW